VKVWVGANADQSLPLAQLAQTVQQWLAGHGERLLALVCNGREVWRDTMNETASPSSADSATFFPAMSTGSQSFSRTVNLYQQETP